MSIIKEALNKIYKYETKLNTDGPFRKGQFVIDKKRFSCDINPQNKICIEKLPLGMVPCIIAVEDDEPGYFKFIKQHSVKFGEGGQFSKVEQTPLTTKYCENRQEAAKEIIRLEYNQIKEDYNKMPYRVVCKDTNDIVIDIQGHSNEKEALADFEAVIEENINDNVAVITLDKLIDGEYEQIKRYNVYSNELMENINETSEDYNEEVAKQLFKKVDANAPIEEYILHTPDNFYNLFMSGDYIVMPGDVMEDILDEIITSLQNTIPAELQMCFDHTRAVDECMRKDLILLSVYEQVQALDKRFDTIFGSVKSDYLKGKKYYIINITE